MSYENTQPKRFSKLSQHTKAEIARDLIKQDHKNFSEAARHFTEKYKTKYPEGISRFTIARIFKEKEKLATIAGSKFMKRKKGQSTIRTELREFEAELIESILLRVRSGLTFSLEAVRQVALRLRKSPAYGNCVYLQSHIFSRNWFQAFKKRKDIIYVMYNGSRKYQPDDQLEQMKLRIKKEISGYAKENIVNADESALYWNQAQKKSFMLKNEDFHKTNSKERITILPFVNQAGENAHPMVVIGKTLTPRDFRGVEKVKIMDGDTQIGWEIKNENILYFKQCNAWNTGYLMKYILHRWDKELITTDRKIVLLLDNFSGHLNLGSFGNIKIIYFPPGLTSYLQPLDCGIFAPAKSFYRSMVTLQQLDNFELGKATKVGMSDVLRMIAENWSKVNGQIIINAWIKSGLLIGECEKEIEEATNQMEKDEQKENKKGTTKRGGIYRCYSVCCVS